MNDNQPLEPQKIPSRLDKIENEIGSKELENFGKNFM